jgi:hypothetical protein
MTQYTPNLSLPYPEASDAPRGWEQIEALAEAVDAGTEPTWYDITLNSGFTAQSGYTPRMCWQNGRVYLSGSLTPDAGWTASTSTAVATLPAGYRPNRLLYVPVQSGTIASNARASVSVGGVLTLYIEGTGSYTNAGIWLDNVSFFSASSSLPAAPSSFAVRPGPRAESEPVIEPEDA